MNQSMKDKRDAFVKEQINMEYKQGDIEAPRYIVGHVAEISWNACYEEMGKEDTWLKSQQEKYFKIIEGWAEMNEKLAVCKEALEKLADGESMDPQGDAYEALKEVGDD